jgi:hypothetical protein
MYWPDSGRRSVPVDLEELHRFRWLRLTLTRKHAKDGHDVRLHGEVGLREFFSGVVLVRHPSGLLAQAAGRWEQLRRALKRRTGRKAQRESDRVQSRGLVPQEGCPPRWAGHRPLLTQLSIPLVGVSLRWHRAAILGLLVNPDSQPGPRPRALAPKNRGAVIAGAIGARRALVRQQAAAGPPLDLGEAVVQRAAGSMHCLRRASLFFGRQSHAPRRLR